MILCVFRERLRDGKHVDFNLCQAGSIPWLESQPGLLAYFSGEPYRAGTRGFVMVRWAQNHASRRGFVSEIGQCVATVDERAPILQVEAGHSIYFNKQYTRPSKKLSEARASCEVDHDYVVPVCPYLGYPES